MRRDWIDVRARSGGAGRAGAARHRAHVLGRVVAERDGDRVRRRKFDIWLTHANAKGRWNLTSTLNEDAYRPRWSPDGTRIAWAGALENGGLDVTSRNTGRTRRLTSGRWELAPDWR